ncbi:TauD/TfdA family dioxygenase [Paucibacter sp. DJ2R-2]|uniref:TauD/TfdA family dioxygenase n=1 Tax=Paucibacter sp. DJ2R-2 TaxID=2893558 RepID=UPI0021E3AA07|nr:TauD/TfdA family dioxygenase [Paucibacter sp. DJ2R-2]MCV2438166.1 TauD/TfdA family dioxygenase [Paucibacter sp. DJ2R-2]
MKIQGVFVVDATELADGVRLCAARAVDAEGLEQIARQLEAPQELASRLQPGLVSELAARGISANEVSRHARDFPYLHLKGVFDPADLPDTPLNWTPIPDTRGTLTLRVAILLLSRLSGMELVSYKSENGGALFVNLVTLDGQGAMAEKSKGPMKGHTDAASFPFRGTNDPSDERIAPSPDVVFLAALRNQDGVPTTVMPLHGILGGLTAAQIEVLKGDRVTLLAQRSFQRGTREILGEAHVLYNSHVLHESDEGTWVRYSHSNNVVDSEDVEIVSAKERFEQTCLLCAQQVVLQPGDVLLVNNRKALHGRAPVGEANGGTSRWLVRGYGLDTTGLEAGRRYEGTPYMLYP